MRLALPRPMADLARYPMRRAELRAQLTRPYWRGRLHALGEGTILHRPGAVFGPHQIAIGSHSLILAGTYLSVETNAWWRQAPVLQIGDRVGIRPYCMISAAEAITIEDDVIIGAFSSVIDSDHSFDEGRPNVMHNSLRTAPVRIGRGTWLAERVSVLRGSTIGRCCIVGAGSVVRGNLPDYAIAVGAPARVVGRVDDVDASAPPFADRIW